MTVRRQRRLKPVFLFILLLAIAAALFFILRSPITMARVNQQLQNFAGNVERESAKRGKKGSFTHGEVTLNGFSFKRTATIADPTIEVADQSLTGAEVIRFMTPRVVLHSLGMSYTAYAVDLPEPVTVSRNGEVVSTIQSASARYLLSGNSENGNAMLKHSIELVGPVTITPNSASGLPVTTISFDPNPVITGKSQPSQAYGEESALKVGNLKVEQGDESVVAANVSGSYAEAQVEETKLKADYQLALDHIVYTKAGQAKPPFSLGANISYKGDIPRNDPQTGQPAPGNAEVAISQLSLSGDDFKIQGQGQLTSATDDPLPYGALTVTIDQFDKLRVSPLVSAPLRPLMDMALNKITGQPAESLTNVTFQVKRDKGGTLMVGNITFEELATSLFSGMIQNMPQSGAAASDAASPSAAPVSPAPQVTEPAPVSPAPNAPQTTAPAAAPQAVTPAPVAPAQ